MVGSLAPCYVHAVFRWALVLLVVVAAAGCSGRFRGSAARGPDGRALSRLERQAQRDMNCAEPMRALALEARAYQIAGCGQIREYAWTCSGRRCAFQPMIPAIVRASADLQCAPQQLTGQADAPTHRAYFGCMRGAAYALLCLDRGCTWSRTSETVTMGAPTPPQAIVATVTRAAPIADPTLESVAIPPPPGAPSAFAPSVPPPPASTPPPTAASPDAVVIPPPPP